MSLFWSCLSSFLQHCACFFFFFFSSFLCSVIFTLQLRDLTHLAESSVLLSFYILWFHDSFHGFLFFVSITLEKKVPMGKRKERQKRRKEGNKGKEPTSDSGLELQWKKHPLRHWVGVAFLPTLPISGQARPPFRPRESFWNWLQLALLLAAFLRSWLSDHQWFCLQNLVPRWDDKPLLTKQCS